MTAKDYLTVEELNYYITNVFYEEELLHNVPVVGEVSGCSLVGGHCYFSLKDKKAQIKIIFYNCPPDYAPKNGEQVLVRGCVEYYGKGGSVNIKAYQITPFGKGAMYEQLEKLRKKLEEEGLFREDRKKPIPVCPRRVGLITSTAGAAMQDFLTTSLKKNSATDITVIDVRVQGEYCVSDVVTALTNADEYGFDVIVLSRGGGSFEDLYCFNDERIVRTLYNMHTPVISAIGHETDYTLCDYVADYRAITPTAAAEKVSFDAELAKNTLLDLAERISEEAENKIDRAQKKLLSLTQSIGKQAELLWQNQRSLLFSQMEKLRIFSTRILEKKESEYTHLVQNLEKSNPLKLLANGYFRLTKDGKTVFDSTTIAIGDAVTVIGEKEKIKATVLSKEEL